MEHDRHSRLLQMKIIFKNPLVSGILPALFLAIDNRISRKNISTKVFQEMSDLSYFSLHLHFEPLDFLFLLACLKFAHSTFAAYSQPPVYISKKKSNFDVIIVF